MSLDESWQGTCSTSDWKSNYSRMDESFPLLWIQCNRRNNTCVSRSDPKPVLSTAKHAKHHLSLPERSTAGNIHVTRITAYCCLQSKQGGPVCGVWACECLYERKYTVPVGQAEHSCWQVVSGSTQAATRTSARCRLYFDFASMFCKVFEVKRQIICKKLSPVHSVWKLAGSQTDVVNWNELTLTHDFSNIAPRVHLEFSAIQCQIGGHTMQDACNLRYQIQMLPLV